MSNGMIDLAKASIRNHEGLRLKPYQCTAGKTTVGYGRNLDDRGVTEREAELLLNNDVRDVIADLETFPYWQGLSGVRQAALIDMRFCLGGGGFRAFKKMHTAIVAKDYEQAAEEILDSRFAQQTGRRADDLAVMMVNG